jgi:4-hydroxybutyrate CoA-transferase
MAKPLTEDTLAKHTPAMGKLATAADGAAAVRAGESLYIGMLGNTPESFCAALCARAATLKGVRVFHHLATHPWCRDTTAAQLRHTTVFATAADRAAIARGQADYLPLGAWAEEHVLRDHPAIDTAVVTLSPPDADGWMSFGDALWLNGVFARQAGRVFAEIDPDAIRTHGDNRIHVSKVAMMWPREKPRGPSTGRALRPDNAEAAARIGTLVARELLRDGDCVQLGIGDVSAAIAEHLGGLNDIGIQTEVLPGGVLPLMQAGNVNGARKEVARGKVIASAIMAPEAELRALHMHPALELWDFTRTDDVRVLAGISNFKAINNALQVDLSGQVTAEAIGPRQYSGPGGQTAFAIAASYSDGGAAITVLPSSSLVDGARRSRIVAHLPAGAVVTVPRTHVDYIVTEFGIARMAGRTLRERAEALIAIAHPDHRDALREEHKCISN